MVERLHFEFLHERGEFGLFEAHADTGAVEQRTIHHAVGVGGLAVAAVHGEFEARVRVRRPAAEQAAAPARVGRVHPAPGAVLVVVGVGARGDGAHVAAGTAAGHVRHQVVAIEAAGERAHEAARGGRVEAFGVALEQRRAGEVAAAVEHRLRALEHGDAVVDLGEDVGRGRVHAHAAAAEDVLPVHLHVEPRAGETAQHRIAVGAALADRGEAGDVL